jgi:hypothetical protein
MTDVAVTEALGELLSPSLQFDEPLPSDPEYSVSRIGSITAVSEELSPTVRL